MDLNVEVVVRGLSRRRFEALVTWLPADSAWGRWLRDRSNRDLVEARD